MHKLIKQTTSKQKKILNEYSKTPAVGKASIDNHTVEEGSFYQSIHRPDQPQLTIPCKHTQKQETCLWATGKHK